MGGTVIPDGSCTGNQDVITAFEYIGNDLFYIACDQDFDCGNPGNEQIRILDLSAFPPTITITWATDTVLVGPINPISGCAPGLVPYGPMADMVCIPEACPTTSNPTTNPTINPTLNPTLNPTTTTSTTQAGGDDDDDDDDDDSPDSPDSDSSESDSSESGGSGDSGESESGSGDDAVISLNEGDIINYRKYEDDKEDIDQRRHLVLDMSESSVRNIWLIVGVFLTVNCILVCCHYKNNGQRQMQRRSVQTSLQSQPNEFDDSDRDL